MEINKTYNDSQKTQTKIRYAGFWIRVGASLIDFVVLLPIIGIGIYNTLHTNELF